MHEQDANQPSPADREIRRRTFISFGVFAALNAAAFGVWKWLRHSPEEAPGVTAGAQKPLRSAFNQTEQVFRNLYSPKHLVKTYPRSAADRKVRPNGDIGLKSALDTAAWKLRVQRAAGGVLDLSLDQLKALPKTELVFDFKCVEGWSQIQYWGGVRLADLMKQHGLQPEAAMQYVGMETPDREYYIGIDMDSALHPQTLLAYEMNGRPLVAIHGAPLRLIVPTKYGIKNLKRIGSIFFSNERPRDYWAEQGYDYYSGL